MLFDDPLSVMGLVPEDYGTLTSLLLDATGLSPAFVLEGGYGPGNPAAINAILESVDGRRFTDPLPEPSATTRARYGCSGNCTVLPTTVPAKRCFTECC